ncbi:unnamed protein product [Gordionus sp. m RMFG-2023]
MSYMDINNASRIGVCGGVIVSQHHVLTAAHCFNIKPNLQNVTLMVGSHVNIAEKIDKDTKLKSLKNCTIHPSYIKGRPGNDLAILKIEGSFNLNEEPWLDKICLPQPETMIEKLGPNCYTLGWGLYDDNATISNILRETCMRPIEKAGCLREKDLSMREVRMIKTENVFCGISNHYYSAGYCGPGDSGGPLVCSDNGIFTLHGIISKGISNMSICILTDVKMRFDWLNQTINN